MRQSFVYVYQREREREGEREMCHFHPSIPNLNFHIISKMVQLIIIYCLLIKQHSSLYFTLPCFAFCLNRHLFCSEIGLWNRNYRIMKIALIGHLKNEQEYVNHLYMSIREREIERERDVCHFHPSIPNLNFHIISKMVPLIIIYCLLIKQHSSLYFTSTI